LKPIADLSKRFVFVFAFVGTVIATSSQLPMADPDGHSAAFNTVPNQI
jgi:hypothetical protein